MNIFRKKQPNLCPDCQDKLQDIHPMACGQDASVLRQALDTMMIKYVCCENNKCNSYFNLTISGELERFYFIRHSVTDFKNYMDHTSERWSDNRLGGKSVVFFVSIEYDCGGVSGIKYIIGSA